MSAGQQVSGSANLNPDLATNNQPGAPAIVTITVKLEQSPGFSMLVSPIAPGQLLSVTIRLLVSHVAGAPAPAVTIEGISIHG